MSGDSSEPRDESHSGGEPLGETMKARDPSLAVHSSREASRHVPPSTNEIVSSM